MPDRQLWSRGLPPHPPSQDRLARQNASPCSRSPFAFSFIAFAKAAVLPEIASATATAVSLWALQHQGIEEIPQMKILAFCRPQMDLRLFCRLLRKKQLAAPARLFSRAKMQVRIFVVLALASFSSPFLSKRIRPESASIRTADRALKRSRLLHFLRPHKAGQNHEKQKPEQQIFFYFFSSTQLLRQLLSKLYARKSNGMLTR